MNAIENVKAVEFISDNHEILKAEAEDIKSMEIVGLSEGLMYKDGSLVPVMYADNMLINGIIESEDGTTEGKKFHSVKIVFAQEREKWRDEAGLLHERNDVENHTSTVEIKLRNEHTFKEIEE